MVNESIIPQSPYKNLGKSQIDLYYTLLAFQKNNVDSGNSSTDDPLCLGNAQLGLIRGRTPETISRNLQKLEKEGFIKMKYKATQNGTERRIFINAE